MTERTINYSPLEQRVTLHELRQFIRQQKGKSKASWWLIIRRSIVALFVAFFVTPVALGFAEAANIPGGFGLVIAVAAMVLTYQVYRYAMYYRHARLARFATTNDLSYTMNFGGAAHDGLIFHTGHSQFTSEVLADYHETYGFEIANYQYLTGHGRTQRTHNYHYIMLKLPRRLPHMVLDARKNNFLGISNLPISFKNAQKLQLEGDFNKYFTLYCPKQYERDALYVFTPDIMAMMIDMGAKYDVEIIDDKLFLYGKGRIRRFNKKLYESAFSILNVFGKKMHARVDYYADERVGDRAINAIDVTGHRLQQSKISKIISTIVMIVFIGLMLWLIFG